MNRIHFKICFCLLVLTGSFIGASCADKETTTLISSFREKAVQAENKAKIQVVRSAAHAYALEFGESQKTWRNWWKMDS
ncbi:MAG: hypothetical protein EHM85_00460 [Desulfobacteraceae bacterium]|nr:MAG: hypothetical protein EHM85_00460 [Desulfobacteraceae bacterium]